MDKQLLANFIGTLITAYVIALFIGMLVINTVSDALPLGFWVWLGFFAVATLLGGVLWDEKSWNLFLLNASYWLINLELMSVVLTVLG